MGNVIHLDLKREDPEETLITAKPWEFRWSHWGGNDFIMVAKSLARHLEESHKRAVLDDEAPSSDQPSGYGPPEGGYGPPKGGYGPLKGECVPLKGGCVPLKGGMADTIRGIFRYRHHEIKMREVYYLAGLVDCMINQVSPLLRTSHIRRIYEKTMTLKRILDVNWYGHLDHVLFPIDDDLYNDGPYRQQLSRAQSLEELSRLIRDRSDHMFDILSNKYAFYAPGRRVE